MESKLKLEIFELQKIIIQSVSHPTQT